MYLSFKTYLTSIGESADWLFSVDDSHFIKSIVPTSKEVDEMGLLSIILDFLDNISLSFLSKYNIDKYTIKGIC